MMFAYRLFLKIMLKRIHMIANTRRGMNSTSDTMNIEIWVASMTRRGVPSWGTPSAYMKQQKKSISLLRGVLKTSMIHSIVLGIYQSQTRYTYISCFHEIWINLLYLEICWCSLCRQLNSYLHTSPGQCLPQWFVPLATLLLVLVIESNGIIM